MLHKFDNGIQFLEAQGINLWAVLDCRLLPPEAIALMQEDQIPLKDYSRLVLLGNGGPKFWESLQAHGMEGEHPVDHFSLEVAKTFIEKYLGTSETVLLYPQAFQKVPLQQLGAVAGWHHPSPLGNGIHPTYGLWFAYRVAFLSNAPLPFTPSPQTHSPCNSCEDRPCVTACPAQAVHEKKPLALTQCLHFRLQENSICEDQCLSRGVCPVGEDFRYSIDQIKYHYLHSLRMIRR